MGVDLQHRVIARMAGDHADAQPVVSGESEHLLRRPRPTIGLGGELADRAHLGVGCHGHFSVCIAPCLAGGHCQCIQDAPHAVGVCGDHGFDSELGPHRHRAFHVDLTLGDGAGHSLPAPSYATQGFRRPLMAPMSHPLHFGHPRSLGF